MLLPIVSYPTNIKFQKLSVIIFFVLDRCAINEDPVTGSAHCAIAPYWFQKLGETGIMVGLQASPRGGVLELSLEGDRVKLAGKCITTMKSKLLV